MSEIDNFADLLKGSVSSLVKGIHTIINICVEEIIVKAAFACGVVQVYVLNLKAPFQRQSNVCLPTCIKRVTVFMIQVTYCDLYDNCIKRKVVLIKLHAKFNYNSRSLHLTGGGRAVLIKL